MRRQIKFKSWAPSSGSYVNLVALNDDIRLEKFIQLEGEREASSDGAIKSVNDKWRDKTVTEYSVGAGAHPRMKEKVEKVLLREINHELPT